MTDNDILNKSYLYSGSSVALGFFDGVHAGHKSVINTAVKMAGNSFVPSVFTFTISDSIPKSKSGFFSIMTEEQKKNKLYSLGIRHIECPDFKDFSGMSGRKFFETFLLNRMNAKAVCCGEDFRFGKNAECSVNELRELCCEYSVDFRMVDKVNVDGAPVSSTRIRSAVKSGNMELARRLLDDIFTIDFEVIAGKQLGRTMNAPTINQAFDGGFLIPEFGVYATVSNVDNVYYPSVTNVGLKPTIGSDRVLSETYIIGFSGDLYGRHIPVGFIKKIRGEKKFDGISSLQRQIHSDIRNAEEISGDFIKTIYNQYSV